MESGTKSNWFYQFSQAEKLLAFSWFTDTPERPELDLAQEKIFDMLSKNVAAALILSTLFERVGGCIFS